MNSIQRKYTPILAWSLNHQKQVFGLAIILLATAIFSFSRMGAEFVPTLDEGDFVIQPILRTGTSLSETIEVCTKIEQTLLDHFPEVEQVVSRIGAAEVPTDPMSMEEPDVIITLKDKSEWTSAKSKDELANLFKEKVEELGVGVEFTQPIEMRFNELITGVQSDIAIKVYGEDIELLNTKAQQIKKLIEEQYVRAKKILKKYQKSLDQLAKLLLKKEVIFKEDLETVLGERKWQAAEKVNINKLRK